MISFVIAACRTRFILSVSVSISSLAFFEAESIAVIRAPCSEATDSKQRAKDLRLDQYAAAVGQTFPRAVARKCSR